MGEVAVRSLIVPHIQILSNIKDARRASFLDENLNFLVEFGVILGNLSPCMDAFVKDVYRSYD